MPDRRLVFAMIALAIAARTLAVLALQSHTIPRSTFEHGEIASNLLKGRGFSVKFLGADGPTSQQAPIYPVLVAAAYAIGGIEAPRSLLILELGQALLGGLLVLSVISLASEAAPGRTRLALFAGLIAAIHPTLVYASTHVQVVSLATLLLTSTLALAYRAGRTGRILDSISTGLLLALLALTDPILALVSPGVFSAIALGTGWRASWKPIAIVGLVAILGVSPWIARNYRVHGELVLIKSSFGYAFWQGNCSLSEGTDKVVRPSVDRALKAPSRGFSDLNRTLWLARHEAGYLDDIALTPSDYRLLGSLTEPARSRLLFHRSLADLRNDPSRYPRLCLRRLRYFFLFDETNPKARGLAYRVPHLGLSILAVVGILTMGSDLRRRLWPTFLTVALIAAFHALTIVSARFHIPIEPILGLWGAAISGSAFRDNDLREQGPAIDHG